MFNTRLARLRESTNLSQRDLAGRLGISRTTYAGYEQGVREPDLNMLNKLADYFEVSVDYLVNGTEGTDFKKRVEAIIDDFISLPEEDQEYIHSLIKRIKKSSN